MATEHVSALIRTHVERYPELEILDVYKLLHQSVYGPGHSIPNRKAAKEWLEQEAAQCTPDDSEPMIESVHPDARIVRLHLRPYLALGGSLNTLLDAYVKSAAQVEGSDREMADVWAQFGSMVSGEVALARRFEPRLIALTGRTRASDGWPANHHSPVFNQRYRPVYRVLTQALADALCRQEHLTLTVI